MTLVETFFLNSLRAALADEVERENVSLEAPTSTDWDGAPRVVVRATETERFCGQLNADLVRVEVEVAAIAPTRDVAERIAGRARLAFDSPRSSAEPRIKAIALNSTSVGVVLENGVAVDASAASLKYDVYFVES